jgi:uncharacterized protein with HEPN domain
MNAKQNDTLRIIEIKTIGIDTLNKIESLHITEEMFLNPKNDVEELMTEGILNRVFRFTEELGKISDSIAEKYNFDTAGARGIRNRLAHVYGDVQRDLVWVVLQNELVGIVKSCEDYLSDNGINESDY